MTESTLHTWAPAACQGWKVDTHSFPGGATGWQGRRSHAIQRHGSAREGSKFIGAEEEPMMMEIVCRAHKCSMKHIVLAVWNEAERGKAKGSGSNWGDGNEPQ